MPKILLVDDDLGTLETFRTILHLARYDVLVAESGQSALSIIRDQAVDLALVDLRLPDISGLDVMRRSPPWLPFVVVTGFGTSRAAVDALRLGAIDFLEKPLFEEELLRTVQAVLPVSKRWARDSETPRPEHEAHAAERLARVLVPIVDSSKDPRTVAMWAQLVFASSGALRNWCSTAGISPRRALVFGRLLRVMFLSRGSAGKLENLLDVADRRTLLVLLRFSGLSSADKFPQDLNEFLKRQTIVRDPELLRKIRSTNETHMNRSCALKETKESS